MTPAFTPNWAESPADVHEYITQAHARCTNISEVEGSGEGIHVGIIDSTCRVPKDIAEDYQVNQGPELSFIPTRDDNPIRHGIAVFRRVSAFAPDAEFSLYQAVGSNRRLRLKSYSEAITRAIEDGVDIVNISAGAPWRHPVEYNPNVEETKRLLDEGITVVAAAGNHFPGRQQDRPPVHCPSAAPGVVSVGGLISRCPREPGQESAVTPEGPYYWIVHDPGFHAELAPSIGIFCGEQGCVGGTECSENKTDEPWERNPLPTSEKPDILAPMHTLRRRDTEPQPGWEYLAVGTSFSAPLVTGSLASIFSQLKN